MRIADTKKITGQRRYCQTGRKCSRTKVVKPCILSGSATLSSSGRAISSRRKYAPAMKTSPITRTRVTAHMVVHLLMRPRPSRRPYISLDIRENARRYADEENRASSTLITSMTMDCSVEPMTVETMLCALSGKLVGCFINEFVGELRDLVAVLVKEQRDDRIKGQQSRQSGEQCEEAQRGAFV
ncbi:hypothetical protein CJEIK_06835 [Corynebacterium jeikeium]|nr:hypothetical protein CJEIK_06835 [Corynebacterium jeikeium]